jgi:hypothetical protein
MDDRRPSLRRVDQENLLKVRRDSKTRRPSLADVIPDWPALHKVKRAEKVKMPCLTHIYQYKYLFASEWSQIDNHHHHLHIQCMMFGLFACMSMM